MQMISGDGVSRVFAQELPNHSNPNLTSSTTTGTTNQGSGGAKRKRKFPGTPDPDAEVIALSPESLMATNRFFCEICNKDFQTDQNLQLHRRSHNLPWKKSNKEVKRKVYICPEESCVYHDPSRALGDLTGIKKHFSRKHGEKKWKCEKCSKEYAVQSDWKAHSKTCGTGEYKGDCGTLFSSNRQSLDLNSAPPDNTQGYDAPVWPFNTFPLVGKTKESLPTPSKRKHSDMNTMQKGKHGRDGSSESGSPPVVQTIDVHAQIRVRSAASAGTGVNAGRLDRVTAAVEESPSKKQCGVAASLSGESVATVASRSAIDVTGGTQAKGAADALADMLIGNIANNDPAGRSPAAVADGAPVELWPGLQFSFPEEFSSKVDMMMECLSAFGESLKRGDPSGVEHLEFRIGELAFEKARSDEKVADLQLKNDELQQEVDRLRALEESFDRRMASIIKATLDVLPRPGDFFTPLGINFFRARGYLPDRFM